MEANVKRVLCRIFALTAPKDDELWEKAALLLDKWQPFDYNQAMMDLGSMICTRSAPACHSCPAQAVCRGKASPQRYPAPKPKKAIRLRHKNIIVMRNHKGQYFATPRASRFLHGLFQFIETDADASRFKCGSKSYSLEKATKLGDIRQQYSHFTLEAGVWLHESNASGNHWHGAGELSGLPMSMAEQKILKLLGIGPKMAATG
jgi:A/G-specific adenine glycosylase